MYFEKSIIHNVFGLDVSVIRYSCSCNFIFIMKIYGGKTDSYNAFLDRFGYVIKNSEKKKKKKLLLACSEEFFDVFLTKRVGR